jgi:hypothetical protein
LNTVVLIVFLVIAFHRTSAIEEPGAFELGLMTSQFSRSAPADGWVELSPIAIRSAWTIATRMPARGKNAYSTVVMWFEDAQETPQYPKRFLAYLMTYGTLEDILTVRKVLPGTGVRSCPLRSAAWHLRSTVVELLERRI